MLKRIAQLFAVRSGARTPRKLVAIVGPVALVGALIATAGSATQLRAGWDDDHDRKGLEGAWDITITTTPNPPFAVPFRILRTVTADGISDGYAFPPIRVSNGSLDFTPGYINSSGHGTWKRIGPRQFAVIVKYFQLNPAHFFGVLDSIGTVTETITISKDGNSYTGNFSTVIQDPHGTVTAINGGTGTATRIQVP